MTTSIAPALGHAVWTQGGTGASPGYDAIDVRRLATDPDLGEGVATYGTYRVSQRAAGANLSVDINQDDFAYVRGDAVSFQGIYKVAPHATTVNETISAADATNPRIDRVVLEVKDSTHDASGSNLAQTRVVTGTPTGGATLDNLTGAGAVPNSALLLADVLVAATDTSISNSEIRDRRAFISRGTVPPLLTAVDMVGFEPPFAAVTDRALSYGGTDLVQVAGAVYLPRRIAGATRLRWRYVQGGTAADGSYVMAIFDASGRKIVDTGSVAFTGVTGSIQRRSETITATTFEPGWYYLFLGVDFITPAVTFTSPSIHFDQATVANLLLFSLTGGLTVPSTILGFSDTQGVDATNINGIPFVALSVG
jgi:hypothetical protein